MIYRIFDPANITYSYWDEYGESYSVLPDGVTAEDRPYSEAQALAALRGVRNQKLLDCDYTQLPDVSLQPAVIEAWRVYRQSLRDITEDLQWNITTWPARP